MIIQQSNALPLLKRVDVQGWGRWYASIYGVIDDFGTFVQVKTVLDVYDWDTAMLGVH